MWSIFVKLQGNTNFEKSNMCSFVNPLFLFMTKYIRLLQQQLKRAQNCSISKKQSRTVFCWCTTPVVAYYEDAFAQKGLKREETILRYISPLLIFAFVDQSGPGYCMSSLIVRLKTWDSEEMAICFEGARLRTKLRFVDLLFNVNFVFFQNWFFCNCVPFYFFLHFSCY